MCWIKLVLQFGLVIATLNLNAVPAFGNPNFYSSCVRTALQGWQNLALVFPVNREGEGATEYAIGSQTSEIPTELGKQVGGNGIENATTKFVLDRDAKDGVFQTGLEYLSIPKHVLKERIRYLLFTKVSKNEYQIMPERGRTEGTNWNPNWKTKILIHGLTSTYWFSAVKNIWLQHIFEIKDAYLDADNFLEGEYNIVVVDWTPLSTVPLIRYPDAAVATLLAAEDIVEFLYNLRSNGHIRTMDDVHMLGHSLGAHVAGIAGRKLQEMDYMVARITGLDPAGPCFDKETDDLDDTMTILDRSDAKFVDIIHTNMGNVFHTVAGRYGSMMETGHADFYPNGGEVQDGCSFLENRMSFCSHQKSVVYYAWSIMKRYMACPCSSWESYGSVECACTMKTGGQHFGEHVDSSARGKFYLPL